MRTSPLADAALRRAESPNHQASCSDSQRKARDQGFQQDAPLRRSAGHRSEGRLADGGGDYRLHDMALYR